MWWNNDPEVLIVGAGPVGLAVAGRLAREGVSVKIVDKQWGPAGRSYALALHPGTVRTLDEMGLGDAVTGAGHPLSRISILENRERVGEVDLSRLSGERSGLVVLPQRELESILEEDLRRHGVEVQWNRRVARVEVEGERPSVTVERLEKDSMGYPIATTGWVVHSVRTMRPRFVVGADGVGSVVRRDSGIGMETAGAAETFAVFEGTGGSTSESQALLALHGETVNSMWPMGDGRRRWSFQIVPSDPELLPRVKDRLTSRGGHAGSPAWEEAFRRLAEERFPPEAGELDEMSWSTVASFQLYVVREFGGGPLWLVGDAAHGASPVGSHSMNVGIQEGVDLADRIARVSRGEAGREILEAWGGERRGEWRRLLGLEGALRASPGAGSWTGGRVARLPSWIPASGREMQSVLDQLGLEWTTPEAAAVPG